MTYEEAVRTLFEKLPIYQRQGALAYKPDIGNIQALCDHYGNPQDDLTAIHIAGTNGKGSTAHILSSILQESGYKVGLHTSPHFLDLRERIKVNGELCSKEFIIKEVEDYSKKDLSIAPSFFELLVAFAFLYFSREKVDIAIVETGLGGRLDATNILDPILSVITNVGHDHMNLLGSTLKDIAKEKGGIIKPGKPVVLGEMDDTASEELQRIARKKGSPIHFAKDHGRELPPSDLSGLHQSENLRTSLTAVEILKEQRFDIPETSMEKGVANVSENTGFMGRWQTLSNDPWIVVDMAHNREALQATWENLKSLDHDRLHLVLGFVNDKEVKELLHRFPTNASYYLCKADIPRAMELSDLQNEVKGVGFEHQVYGSVEEALRKAVERRAKNDLVLVLGSAFVVAEVLKIAPRTLVHN